MTEKQVAKTDTIGNDTKQLVEKTVSEVISTVLAEKKGTGRDVKADKFCLYLAFGFPIETCAKLSGCSMSWAYRLHAKYGKNTKKLVERIAEIAGQAKEQYQVLTKLKLPLIAQLDDLGIAEYRENPRLIVEKPGLLRQLKQVSGVIEDESVAPRFVSIENLQIIQNYIHEQQSVSSQQVEAEVIDID